MNLTEARTALAAAVSELDGVTCRSHPVKGNLRLGDAFVTAGRRTLGQFQGSHFQVLTAWVALGTDERTADLKVDEWAGPLLDAVADLYAADVAVEAEQIITGTTPTASVFALSLTATFELSS